MPEHDMTVHDLSQPVFSKKEVFLKAGPYHLIPSFENLGMIQNELDITKCFSLLKHHCKQNSV